VIVTTKAPAAGPGASVKAESQISASAQQAKLSNQLDFAQKKPANNPLLKNADAQRAGQFRDNAIAPWTGYRKDWNASKQNHPFPRTLSTGSGDDTVDIRMGDDGRVHVQVNGKEAWTGTTKEFQYLTIDTGAGKDVVTNYVDGATILTGSQADRVYNSASGTTIDTGDGDDVVHSGGYSLVSARFDGDGNGFPGAIERVVRSSNGNVINTGKGNDTVNYMGSNNTINTGDDNDTVESGYGEGHYGNDNSISTGSGADSVKGGTRDGLYDPDNC
jgi:Ca2+-binding RTX toxin-like protein